MRPPSGNILDGGFRCQNRTFQGTRFVGEKGLLQEKLQAEGNGRKALKVKKGVTGAGYGSFLDLPRFFAPGRRPCYQ
jgi:hypothetical protein